MTSQSRGYLSALAATTFLSTTGIFIGYLVQTYHMPALVLAFWRDVFVSLGLVFGLLVVRRSLLVLPHSRLPFLLLFGLLLGVFNAVWTLSVQLNGAAVATVLGYGSAGFTALLDRLINKEPLGLPKSAAILVSLCGITLVSGAHDPAAWGVNLLGILVGLLSGVLYAIYNLMGKACARHGINPWTTMLYTFAPAAFFLLLFNLIPSLPGTAGSAEGILPNLPLSGWLVLVTFALVPSLFGYGLYVVSLGYLAPSIANLIATLEPMMTAAEAYIFLGERLTAVQIFGGALIIAAVVLVRLSEGKRRVPPRQP